MNVPTIDIQKTGANIKTLRKAAGIKVKDVADTLGVSTQAVAKWQAAKRSGYGPYYSPADVFGRRTSARMGAAHLAP